MAFSSACKTSIDEYRKIKDAHPTLSPADILIQFEKCPPWYWKHIRDNTKKKKQDNLTNVVSHSMGLSENQSLSYAFIPRLEDLLNVNIYVLSSALGNAFSYISQNHDQERKKNILVSRREGIGGSLSRHRENWWIFCTFKFLLLVS